MRMRKIVWKITRVTNMQGLRPKLGAFLVVELYRTRCRTRWPRMSQTCSIGDKSGDRAGQSRWYTLFCCRNCCTILARWGLALSSCSTTWYHKTFSSIPVMFNNGAVRCGRFRTVWTDTLIPVLERRLRSSALTGTRVSVQTVRNRLHSAGQSSATLRWGGTFPETLTSQASMDKAASSMD